MATNAEAEQQSVIQKSRALIDTYIRYCPLFSFIKPVTHILCIIISLVDNYLKTLVAPLYLICDQTRAYSRDKCCCMGPPIEMCTTTNYMGIGLPLFRLHSNLYEEPINSCLFAQVYYILVL